MKSINRAKNLNIKRIDFTNVRMNLQTKPCTSITLHIEQRVSTTEIQATEQKLNGQSKEILIE